MHHSCIEDSHPDIEVTDIIYKKAPFWWIKHGNWTPENQDAYHNALQEWEEYKRASLPPKSEEV